MLNNNAMSVKFNNCDIIFIFIKFDILPMSTSILMAGPSSRSPVDIVGSNLTGGMDVCLLWLLYNVR
jgi:hypothetical protein